MLKSLSKERQININFKASPSELKLIKSLADKHAGGNVSAWLRERGKTAPMKSELKGE